MFCDCFNVLIMFKCEQQMKKEIILYRTKSNIQTFEYSKANASVINFESC